MKELLENVEINMEVMQTYRDIGSLEEMRLKAKTIANYQAKVNSHVHLPPNFSAFNSVEQVLEQAVHEGVKVIGVTNYYDYQVYAKFATLSRVAGVFPIFGLEVISLVDHLIKAKTNINDPGNPGRLYLCGKGALRFMPVPDEALSILTSIRTNDAVRIQEMINKVNALFVAADCQLEVTATSIKKLIAERNNCPVDSVYLQERHIAQAFQEALVTQVPELRRTQAIAQVYGARPKASFEDSVLFQNEFRSHLLKAGKPAFVVETFSNEKVAKKMILQMGGIPCYPTLIDGASPICPYELTPEELIGNILGIGIYMAEFIPIRNSPEMLEVYVKAMRAAGLVVVAGTEHNTLDSIPLEPTCIKGQPISEELKAIFWEGACVIAAHQFLIAHGQEGFVDGDGNLSRNYLSPDTRIKDFATLGSTVIQTYLGVN